MPLGKEYNGWRSYETWLINIWMDEYGLADDARERVSGMDRYDAGKEMKTLIEDFLDEEGLAETGMLSDLAGSALAEVDWEELADHFLEDND